MIVVRTPLRISLLGGGTDFEAFYKRHGGAVLSTAINKYVYVIVKPSYDDLFHIRYSQNENISRIEDIRHDLIREALRLTGVTDPLDVVTMADVPSTGTGLGSSSSITVGLLHALHVYKGDTVTPERLADEACHIEIDVLKRPIGKQDQYIAAYGGFRLIEFDKEIRVTSVTPPATLKDHLLLLHTGIGRDAHEILAKHNLSSRALCAMRDLAYAGVGADAGEIARLLKENWTLKKSVNQYTTTSEIDRLYDLALQNGAVSGKICGAGGGGYLLLYCEDKDRVRRALCLKELTFGFEPQGSTLLI